MNYATRAILLFLCVSIGGMPLLAMQLDDKDNQVFADIIDSTKNNNDNATTQVVAFGCHYHNHNYDFNDHKWEKNDGFWTKCAKGFAHGFMHGPEQLGAQTFNLLVSVGIGVATGAINKFIIQKILGTDEQEKMHREQQVHAYLTQQKETLEYASKLVFEKEQEVAALKAKALVKKSLISSLNNASSKDELQKEIEAIENLSQVKEAELQELKEQVGHAQTDFIAKVYTYQKHTRTAAASA